MIRAECLFFYTLHIISWVNCTYQNSRNNSKNLDYYEKLSKALMIVTTVFECGCTSKVKHDHVVVLPVFIVSGQSSLEFDANPDF